MIYIKINGKDIPSFQEETTEEFRKHSFWAILKIKSLKFIVIFYNFISFFIN
jgi:hypothetical protein